MVCNTMRIFKNIIKIFFYLTFLEFLDLFIFIATRKPMDEQIQLKFSKRDQASKVVKSLSRQNVNKTVLLYMLNKAILKSGDGPGEVRHGGKCKIFPRDIVSPRPRLVQVPRTCCEIAHNFAANTVLI